MTTVQPCRDGLVVRTQVHLPWLARLRILLGVSHEVVTAIECAPVPHTARVLRSYSTVGSDDGGSA